MQLHEAICAVSTLNLAYSGRSSLEEAIQRYTRALSAMTASSSDDLLSDGVFLTHFLLFIYDICIPMQSDNGGADMWASHLHQLHRIATSRHERLGHEPHAYILWSICELDMYACLLGSGNCEFVRTVRQYNMLPPLDQQIPSLDPSVSSPYLANEASFFPSILALDRGLVIQTAKLAQSAHMFRNEAANSNSVSPGVYARWQARVTQLQSELSTLWIQSYPGFLDPESPEAGQKLPSRVRYVFEHVSTLELLTSYVVK